MKYKLISNTPINVADIIADLGAVVANRPVNDSCLLRIEHKITQWTKVYYEWCSTDLGGGGHVTDMDSNYLENWEFIEFAIEYNRLDSVWLLACCQDTEIYLTLL